jgi:hypothetical protein
LAAVANADLGPGEFSIDWLTHDGTPYLAIGARRSGARRAGNGLEVWSWDPAGGFRRVASADTGRQVNSVAWLRGADGVYLAVGVDAEREAGDRLQVWAWDGSGGTLECVAAADVGTGLDIRSMAWLVDNHLSYTQLAVGTSLRGKPQDVSGGEVQLWLWERAERRLTRFDSAATDYGVGPVAWMVRDGGVFLAAGLVVGARMNDGRLQVWSLDEPHGGLTPVAEADTGQPVWSVAWLVDSNMPYLAIGTGEYLRHGSAQVWVWNGPGAELVRLAETKTGRQVESVDWVVHNGVRWLAGVGDSLHAGGQVQVWAWDDAVAELTPVAATDAERAVALVVWLVHDGVPYLAVGGHADRTGGAWLRVYKPAIRRVIDRELPNSSDVVGDSDELERDPEVRALADLIAARRTGTPLAVGLFGNWGEGKSHFLGRLAKLIDAAPDSMGELAYSHIRHVRFSAWHYAETELWASLVAELFAQLAAPHRPRGQDGGSVERLRAELELTDRLHRQRDKLAARAERLRKAAANPTLSDLMPEEIRPSFEAYVGACAAGLPDYYGGLAVRIAAIKETGRALTVPVRLAWEMAKQPRVWSGALGGALLVTALYFLPGIQHHLASWLAGAAAILAPATAVIVRIWRKLKHPVEEARKLLSADRANLTRLADASESALKAVDQQIAGLSALGRLGGFVTDRNASNDYRQRLGVMTDVHRDLDRLAQLLREVAAEQDSADSWTPTSPSGSTVAEPAPHPASGRIARLLPRLRASRRKATAMSTSKPQTGHAEELRRQWREAQRSALDAAGDSLPRIDRVVIYIDDLDRCPPAKVVEMLEAIHLLLALDLFVVVVAIDPRWLLRAVTAHYREVLDVQPLGDAANGNGYLTGNDESDLWHSTPAQYLEKIFQIVFTLPAMTSTGFGNLVDEFVGTAQGPNAMVAATGPDAAQPEQEAQQSASRSAASSASEAASAPTATAHAAVSASFVPEAGIFNERGPDRPLETVTVVSPVALTPGEIQLLKMLGPPHFVITPRAAKRLANSYALLTAIRRRAGKRNADLQQTAARGSQSDEMEQPAAPAYRAGLVLLACLVSYPALGPALCRHLHRTAADDRQHSWNTFVAGLAPHPRKSPGHGWCNQAEPSGFNRRYAEDWNALHAALTTITQEAAAQEAPLPDELAVWHDWVEHVARLSFPSGRVVSTLQRPDLPTPDDSAHGPTTNLPAQKSPESDQQGEAESASPG